jgi:acyl-CoA thioesterase-1
MASRPYGAWRRGFNVLLILALALPVGMFASGAAQARQQVILALGDSLTAGYGLMQQDSFPARLQAALRAGGIEARVVNAGVSGDTSAGALRRVDWLMTQKPDLVIVEFGGNDGLRGLDPAETKRNLDAVIARVRQHGARVLLAGMLAPPNLGRDYGAAFNAVFPQLAKRHKVVFYPFFLDGVAAKPALNLADGIHPNAKGVAVIVERILPYVRRALGEAG